MQQRSLGTTGLRVSRLGLGTMTWGRDTDEHEARDQLIAFAEAGGTLVDTAAGYTDGDSERLVGSLIGDVVARDEVVLATKAGISRRSGERVTDTSRGHLLTTLDASLRRLGVDHVDLWQVHVWSDRAPLEETLSALDTAVSSGRASYVGISNYTGWQTAQAATWQRAVPGRAPVASTQVEYSLLNRLVEREVLPAAEALGLGVLPWSPLGRGVLTGKYRGGTPSDSRGASPVFSGFVGAYLDDGSARIVEAVARAARRARLDAARGRAGLGARPARRHGADRRGPHRAAAARVAGPRGQIPA
jgi:aryl-alcohol dehydrogenase-like predicted oxidoreductase